MSARELLRSNHLSEAIAVAVGEVRDNPADSRRRTFLFELLCFAGEFDRAAKQLTVLADESPDAGRGVLFYRSALSAARTREELFDKQDYPKSAPQLSRPGTLNGRPFKTIEDCDPRIGPRLETFLAGECVWLPFEHIVTLQMSAPQMLRDTLWPSAQIAAGSKLGGEDFGEVIVPVLYPFSAKHPIDAVKLGHETVWDEAGVPFGQKLLLLDDEHVVPYLEIRELRFQDGEISGEGMTAVSIDSDH